MNKLLPHIDLGETISFREQTDIDMPTPTLATHATGYQQLISIINDEMIKPIPFGRRVIGSEPMEETFPVNFSVGANWQSTVMFVYNLDHIVNVGAVPVVYLTWGIDRSSIANTSNELIPQWWQRMPLATELKSQQEFSIYDAEKLVVNINEKALSYSALTNEESEQTRTDLFNAVARAKANGIDVVTVDIPGNEPIVTTEFSDWCDTVQNTAELQAEEYLNDKGHILDESEGNAFPPAGVLRKDLMEYNRFITHVFGVELDNGLDMASEAMTNISVDEMDKLVSKVGSMLFDKPAYQVNESEINRVLNYLEDRGWLTIKDDSLTLLNWWP